MRSAISFMFSTTPIFRLATSKSQYLGFHRTSEHRKYLVRMHSRDYDATAISRTLGLLPASECLLTLSLVMDNTHVHVPKSLGLFGSRCFAK